MASRIHSLLLSPYPSRASIRSLRFFGIGTVTSFRSSIHHIRDSGYIVLGSITIVVSYHKNYYVVVGILYYGMSGRTAPTVPMPDDLLDEITERLDYGDSRAAWIREACRQRLERENEGERPVESTHD